GFGLKIWPLSPNSRPELPHREQAILVDSRPHRVVPPSGDTAFFERGPRTRRHAGDRCSQYGGHVQRRASGRGVGALLNEANEALTWCRGSLIQFDRWREASRRAFLSAGQPDYLWWQQMFVDGHILTIAVDQLRHALAGGPHA